MKNTNKIFAAMLAVLLLMTVMSGALADRIISPAYKPPVFKQPAEQAEVPDGEEAPVEESTPAEAKSEKPEEKDEGEAEAPVVYEYERDENGELILDEQGNPVAIVPEGCEIPVKFERDEEGNLVLDDSGNPIVIETVPAGSTEVDNWTDYLDPNRYIKTYLATEGAVHYGDTVEFIAVMYGYENASYDLCWQQMGADGVWQDMPGETDLSLFITVTKENAGYSWRMCVDVYDAAETAAD